MAKTPFLAFFLIILNLYAFLCLSIRICIDFMDMQCVCTYICVCICVYACMYVCIIYMYKLVLQLLF